MQIGGSQSILTAEVISTDFLIINGINFIEIFNFCFIKNNLFSKASTSIILFSQNTLVHNDLDKGAATIT